MLAFDFSFGRKLLVRNALRVLGLDQVQHRLHDVESNFRILNVGIDALQGSLGEISGRLSTIHADIEKTHAEVEDVKSKSGSDTLINLINAVNHSLYTQLRDASRVREFYYRDVMIGLDHAAEIFPRSKMEFVAEKPVAIDSDDHQKPWGVAHDNTRSPRFVAACEAHFNRPLTVMDLGCAGGGLVLDFALRGHRAYGIEGSDHPKRAQRAEWRVLRHNLFTADITRRFRLSEVAGGPPIQCDIITMWEVLEHISEADLPELFENIQAHLKPDGLFIGSIALIPDDHNGASYHRTVKSREWWRNRFRDLGVPMVTEHGFEFEDFCRGTGNGPMDPNFREFPDTGCHFVASFAEPRSSVPHLAQAAEPARIAEPQPIANRYFGLTAPLFIDAKGEPRLVQEAASMRHPVFVVSMPKSGTYLIAALLQKLNVKFTGAHMSEQGFTDYRNRSLREIREDYESFTVTLPLTDALALVRPGQFAVGHLVSCVDNVERLKGFKCLFLLRELRSALVSCMRFEMAKGRAQTKGGDWKIIADPHMRMERYMALYGAERTAYLQSVAGWISEKSVLPVRFETLLGDDGPAAQESLIADIGRHLGLDLPNGEVRPLLDAVLGAQTATWSGQRSQLDRFWSPACESAFVALAGVRTNELLGYRV